MKPNTYFNYCFSLNLILISLKKYASFVKKKILFRDIKKFINLICIILIYRVQQCVTGI